MIRIIQNSFVEKRIWDLCAVCKGINKFKGRKIKQKKQ